MSAWRRAIRVAVVAPAAFAVASVFLPADTALFAAFGSIIQIVFVDFAGPARLARTLGVAVATSALVAVGGLLSASAVAATILVGVLAFLIAYGGIASTSLALAASPLLLALTLSATVPADVSDVLPRVAAWGTASVLVIAAKAVILPTATDDPLRTKTVDALDAILRHIRTGQPQREVEVLRHAYLTHPRRPDGFRPGRRRLLLVIDAVLSVDEAVGAVAASPHERLSADEEDAVTDAIELVRTRVDEANRNDPLVDIRVRLEDAREHRERRSIRGAVDESWPAHQLLRRVLRLLDADVAADTARGRYVLEVLRSHWSWRSAWLRNSARTSLTLAASIAAANVVGAEHAFWVAFGTLAVLRSNAASTARSAGQAILGTVIGVIVVELLLVVVPHAPWLAWAILPFALAVMALAPEVLPFMLSQAAFSVAILDLFVLAAPQQPTIGMVRFEDVLLGVGVSACLGWLLWPRGVLTAFRSSVGAAYVAAADYVVAAVRSTVEVTPPGDTLLRRRAAVAAGRRLDDAFREVLLERGSVSPSATDMIRLIVAPTTARETADAVLDLGAHLRNEHQLRTNDEHARRLIAPATAYRTDVRNRVGGLERDEEDPASATNTIEPAGLTAMQAPDDAITRPIERWMTAQLQALHADMNEVSSCLSETLKSTDSRSQRP
ncbi:FUSC family protein [Curtobacterium sp. MCBD17_003]|uniref:FUSC family protein n=1 Tax=Curtobacterium sp. MCBD17_003 TaxID=2175667 RepID=UPI0015E8DFF3|nr:FUSC family protein [Curtobacterium sp. MCBD17_003]WIE54750.1 FUSC family protein [Curtobacterium sp. MCBD17_003]